MQSSDTGGTLAVDRPRDVDAEQEELMKRDRGEPESLRLGRARMESNLKLSVKGRRTVTLSRERPLWGISV